MRRSFISAACLLAGVLTSSATVTPYSWIRLGETGNVFADSSGANHPFNAAFSSGCVPGAGGGGNPAILFSPLTAGGPLGLTGATSTTSTRWGYYGCPNSGMWIQGPGAGGSVPDCSLWCLPPTNWVMECWVLPVGDGRSGSGSSDAQFMSTGSPHFGGTPGGVAFRTHYDSGSDTVEIRADAIGPAAANNFTIGTPVVSDRTKWIHVAVVNANGITTFYVNGVPSGPSTNNVTAPSGVPYIGSGEDTGQAFDGYLDECRYSTFAPGAFSTNDLLLVPQGPSFISQPQSTTVWAGGAAPFRISTVYDASTTYQWRRGGVNLSGATTNQYVVPTVNLVDSGAQFDCVVTASSITKTSSVAVLTVIANNPSNVAAYRNLIQTNASLLAYFPVDNDIGTTLTNTKDGTHNGTLELNAIFDGRTNAAFGQRAVSVNGDGDVQVPNNPAFEFPSGDGTIEAVIYLDPAAFAPSEQTIVAEALDGGTPNYFFIRAAANGNSIIYGNDSTPSLSWNVLGGLSGKRTHLAFVFDHGTNVTAYVNGLSLGTKVQTSFGAGSGTPLWLGSMGTSATANWLFGSIDELSIYGTALSQNTIQLHYSGYFFGTNTSAPSILTQSSSKTILAGGSPVLYATAAGTLPLTYQWSANSVAIPGATKASLALSNVTSTTTYRLAVQNAYGTTNSQPIVLTVAAPPAGYATTVMQDHPAALWRLSETSGTTAVDSAGLNDGTYSGGFTLGAAPFHGETGTAAHFDGSSGRAIVPNSPAFNPDGPFTIELWGKLDNNNGNKVALSSLDRPTRGAGYEYYMGGNYNGWEFHTGGGGNYDGFWGDSTKQPVGPWWHIVGTYDGTQLQMYVNGALGEDASNPGNGNGVVNPPFVPNTTKNLFIGSRSDSAVWWPGSLANVAFYNYVLSPAQISNHYAVAYEPAVITQQPAGVTNTEGSTISLSVAANGLPNSYQWQKGGVDLVPFNNNDGTLHYSLGVNNKTLTGSTLTISQVVPADSGQYRVVISNPVGGATSLAATVLIQPSTNPPAVTQVLALGTPNSSGPTPYLVKVVYNKRVDPVTAGDVTKYSISGGVINSVSLLQEVAMAPLGGDWRTAYLVTTGLVPGQKYSLTVTGVRDQSVTPLTITPAATYFRAPLLTTGSLEWDYYYLGSGGPVTTLYSNTNYPNAPQTNAFATVFNSGQITGDDLNNVPGFGPLGDNYGSVLSGWITPTVSGDYTFFLSSDDASELNLSPDSNPANAVLIAQEPGCCHAFTEPPATYTSDPQTLTAGVPYYIRASQIEGGGGDYVRVAWRLSTDTTPAANLPPIQSSVLASYKPVPRPQFNAPVLSGGTLTISWSGYQTIVQESTDLINWTPVPGNPNPLVITVSSAPKKFYRLVQ